MTLSIDHIVISVNNLQLAMTNFRQAGFIVNYGGRHADNITENALIILGNGAYIELIALAEGASAEYATFKDLLRPTEGYTGYALLTADLESAVNRLHQAGMMTTGGARDGSRYRPDGVLLRWRMARIAQHMSPFIIRDITSRELHVPVTPENIDHPNTVTGIRDIKILAQDFTDMVFAYQAITGITPQVTEHEAVFMMDNSNITLSKPFTPEEQNYLMQNGSVPFLVTFASNDETAFMLHGARIAFGE